MHLRRVLLLNTWLQLFLVIGIVVLVNLWGAGRFLRLDLTADKQFSLDLVTRALMYELERPLYVKVYFTEGLQAPYNNHRQIVIDKLEELRAYSRGLMEIDVVDPTGLIELEEEAERFGVRSIQYRYQSANVSELKKVYMGIALVYGDRQQVLPAVTQTDSLEYSLARAIQGLVRDQERKTVAYVTGHGEPDLLTGRGPLGTLRGTISAEYDLTAVSIDGQTGVPPEVDALFVIGPQRPLSDRALYHLDQYLMRGGALAVMVTNTRPDLRSLRAQPVYHGLDALVGHYGVQLNRDLVIDRERNGQLPMMLRGQGRQAQVDHPLIPRATELNRDSIVVKELDNMLFPFAGSLTLADPLPPDVRASVLVSSSPRASRLRGVRSIDPAAFRLVNPSEEVGSFPLLVSLIGTWQSFYADKDIPSPEASALEAPYVPDAPASKLRQGAEARLVVANSADFVANNIPYMLNQLDWMVQDESLIGIRSKTVTVPTLEPLDPEKTTLVKAANLLIGPLLLLLGGMVRALLRRRQEGSA